MVQHEEVVYLVHFRKAGGKSIFLSPFNRSTTLLDDERRILGLFGNEPAIESISHVKELLYSKVDIEVRRRLSERRFIPKFLLSALVFLVVYFFLSFTVRIPLPIVEQAVGASVAAVLCFVFIGRRDELSVRAVDERAEGRARVDAIAFEQSDAWANIENLMQQASDSGTINIRDLCDALRSEKDKLDPELQKQAGMLIDEKIKARVLKRLPKRFGDLDPDKATSWNDMKRWCEVFRVDPSLVALHLSFNLQVARVK